MINNESPKIVQGHSKETSRSPLFLAMKTRLQQYRDLNRDIENEIERLERLEERSISPSSSNLSGMPKSSYFQDKMLYDVDKISSLQGKILSLIQKRNDERDEIEQLVSKLLKADERAVIRMRYIDTEEWVDILFMLYGRKSDYDENIENYKQRMFRLHCTAIENLSQICKKA